jgi:hypothetical protein
LARILLYAETVTLHAAAFPERQARKDSGHRAAEALPFVFESNAEITRGRPTIDPGLYQEESMNTLLIRPARSLGIIFVIVLAVSLSRLSLPAHAVEGGNDHSCAAPPISTITSPLAGAQIGGVTTYTITGTASSAGTSVLKVKVSTNGGKSWHLATDTSGNASWASWSFTWKMSSNTADDDGDIDPGEKKVIKDGSYVIKSRAKSHSGCVETAGPGVTVTVDNTEPVTTASAAGYVFGSMTAVSPVSVTLTASDGSGSGVADGSPEYCVDTSDTCTPDLSYTAAINVACYSKTKPAGPAAPDDHCIRRRLYLRSLDGDQPDECHALGKRRRRRGHCHRLSEVLHRRRQYLRAGHQLYRCDRHNLR